MPDPICDGCGERYLPGTGREGYCAACKAEFDRDFEADISRVKRAIKKEVDADA